MNDAKHSSASDLKRVWIKQLYLEYERLCYSYKLRLSPVTIGISSWQHMLGQWDPRARMITLSEALIRHSSWGQVIEVLKHEMAHQIVAEIYGQSDHRHGPLFHKACQRLGLAHWARRASVLQAEDLAKATSQGIRADEEGMLRKAQKLLALASSSNEHEAFAAMKKVQQLYEVYHLRSLVDLEKPDFTSVYIEHKKKRTELYQTMIGSLLVRHFYVRVIHASLFDAGQQQEYRVVELLGIPRHVQLAEYVYWFISNHLPCLWEAYRRQSGRKGTAVRNQFYQGVVTGFDEKLEKAKREREQAATFSSHEHGLICMEDARLQEFVEERHPRLKNTSYSLSRRDFVSFEAGRKEGRALTLHHGLTAQEKRQTPLFLPSER